MDKKTFVILILIIILATFLRVYNLGNNNLGFFRDEAALGYNTWAILKTGSDEFGQRLPVIFRSFEVFFMPAYVYLSLPIFLIFGLNEFSSRLLAAIAGVVIVWLVYLISNRLFKSQKVGLIASFIVATSPWAIFYSRGAFEGNLSLMFFSAGVYFWILFLEKMKRRFFIFSILTFVMSMYSYQAPRFVAPLFIGLSIVFYRKWYKKWRLWLVGGIFAIILYFPIARLTLAPASYHRAAGVSIFTNNNFSGNILNELTSLYLSYYSPSNLFWNGDYNLQRHVPNFSVFYFWQILLFGVGLWYFVREKHKYKKVILIWFLIAPIPAALTPDPFHTYRAILFWVPVSIIISYGLYKLTNKKSKLVYTSFIIVTFLSLVYFMFSLLNIAPVQYWRQWDFGYKEMSDYIKKQPNSYRVIIDDPQTESYIHFLFYQNIDLNFYQKLAGDELGSKYYESSEEIRPTKVGRFEFRPVDWPSERGDKNTIFIFPAERLQPSEFTGDPKLKWDKTIYSPDGKDAFYIIKTL